jgi:hypothetical protein
MPERVSRVVLTERCAPDQQTFSESVGMSQGCEAATLRALRALRRTLRSAASQRERSQVREVSGVPWCTTTIRFPNRIRYTMSACGEARLR